MAIIYTYPTKTTPNDNDLLLISDSQDGNSTKKIKISSLPGGSGAGVSSITSANAAITVTNPTSTAVMTSVAYSGEDNIGHVPTGGDNTTFLRGDGTWVVPTAPVTSVSGIAPGISTGIATVVTPTTGLVTIQPMAFNGAGNVGHVPDASAAAATAYLKNDGSWATPPDTDTTYSMMTDAVLGLGKLEDNTTQTTAANAVTTTASRTYGIQKNSSNQLVVNVPWTDSGAGTAGWDILNFAQGQGFTGSVAITNFYQVVVPESFSARKAKIYVDVAGGGSYTVAIYDGVLSNLAAATKLGDGAVTPGGDGIIEVSLTAVSAGDLNLTQGQNIIMAFAQSAGSKLLCINGRVVDANLAITAAGIPPMPSNLGALEEQGTTALRPCCVLYA